MSRALHNFCHAERKQALVITCASLMFCQPCQLRGRSCSNPVHIEHQYCRQAHAVTTLREPFASQFSFSQRARSMKSVCLAMSKAENAGLRQTPQTLCWEELRQLMGQWFSNPVHISITLIASTKQRSHMQVSSSHHCERTNLSTVSVLAKGQINAECVLRNVKS